MRDFEPPDERDRESRQRAGQLPGTLVKVSLVLLLAALLGLSFWYRFGPNTVRMDAGYQSMAQTWSIEGLVLSANVRQQRVCRSDGGCSWVLWVQVAAPEGVARDRGRAGALADRLSSDVQAMADIQRLVVVSVSGGKGSGLVEHCREFLYAVPGHEADKVAAAQAWAASGFRPCR